MTKSPGFWFFTGDWLKDPELRFCSIFARGLLVDLLCYMFEAKEQGYLVWPDGTARTDREIAEAISGGEMSEKLAAIAELEKKGVLSRDFRGALFSRRLVRLAEISQTRQQVGSKGGSKRQANRQANEQQKQGVTVSVSDSVSDTFNNPPLPPKGKRVVVDSSKVVFPESLDTKEFREAWEDWCNHRKEIRQPMNPVHRKKLLNRLASWGVDRAIAAIDHTITMGWQGIREPNQVNAKKLTNEEVPF